MFSRFHLCYRDTGESLGEVDKAVLIRCQKILALARVPKAFPILSNFCSNSIKQLDYELEISIVR